MSKRLRRSCSTRDMTNDLSRMLPSGWGSKRRLQFYTTKDRISDLPDPILCHILSFLPTKLTVVTSTLSKRWKTIFRHVPSYIMYKPFIKSHHLWSALQCRDPEYPIPLFRLFCNEPEAYNPLITAATQRGVETLELNMLSSTLEKTYLSNILTCKTLTVLKLTNVIIKERDLPRINVSSIKTLHLDTINFIHTSSMINFFLSFPNLEELEINDVHQIFGRRVIPQTSEMNKSLLNLVRANISDIELIPFLCFSRALILNVNEEIQNENEIDDKNWEEPQTIPECLSSQLKTCLIRFYRGTSSELQFAEYVMRNSKVLLAMTIHSSSTIDINTKYQVLQKLSLSLRSCKLVFD
ncbi:F-box/FBD/LRR-repeat protein At3g52680-like [Vicia villosa]|uniref:F-box/FBD/LRR-repeat protein At3g52680-like n=1 Tax=Vicia villosa TaxID=3911 RepID=UPI00273B12D3|nr:F-box/FBD/LRR-repeat protein At3g52680-like [Vicia villosa]